MQKAQSAGGRDLECAIERFDNIVEQDGDRTFFESRIIAVASGRASGQPGH